MNGTEVDGLAEGWRKYASKEPRLGETCNMGLCRNKVRRFADVIAEVKEG